MSKPVCSKPFYELVLMHDGNIMSCNLLVDYVIGNFKEMSIEEAWNHPLTQKLREEHLSGEISICKEHIDNRKCNTCLNPEAFESKVIINQHGPKKIDLRLNGQCNLECIMCDIWEGPNGVYSENGFWDSAPKDLLPQVEEIELLGGEPMVQRDVYKLFDVMYDVNPDCRFRMTTNAHWAFTKRVREIIERHNFVSITISIDSIFPDTFSKIRKKGDLKVVLKNLEIFRELREKKGFELNFNIVIQKDNLAEAFSFPKFAKKMGMDYSFIYCLGPDHLSPSNLEKEEKLAYLKKLKDFYEKTGESEFLQIIRPLELSL